MRESHWEDLIADNPEDHTVRLAYADWLEESGEERKAEAVRWCLQEGKAPRKGISNQDWCWWSHDVWPSSDWEPDDLPGALFERLPGCEPEKTPQVLWYRSRLEAEKALFEAYVSWKNDGLDEQPTKTSRKNKRDP